MNRKTTDQLTSQNPLSQNPGTDYDELLDPPFNDEGGPGEDADDTGEDVLKPALDPARPGTLPNGPDVIDDDMLER